MHIRRWIFGGLVVLAAGYFFYEARDFLFAPALEIYTPQNFSTINTASLHIAGRTAPRLKVWISGREAQSDENGNFEDYLPVFPGYNEIGLKVSDKFGNETRKVLKIVVQ